MKRECFDRNNRDIRQYDKIRSIEHGNKRYALPAFFRPISWQKSSQRLTNSNYTVQSHVVNTLTTVPSVAHLSA